MKNKITYLFIIALFTLMYSSGYAQGKVVKGKVTDAAGLPLPGANVIIKGTQKGTSTDFDGNYTINAATGQVLVFTYTGSKTEEKTIGQSSVYDVKLTDSNNTLEEVVVVGYGTKKKKDLTGSIVSVGAEEIASRPVQNAVQAIQGKAAGVDISSNERPGTVGSIRIRGARSISASNSPLYVVDGIPLNSGGIDFINPNDIESIDVLKDASATAIYGSRGANGVIIVTTKKGKNGKYTLNYDTSIITETIHENARMMNSAEYIELRRWARYYSNPAGFPRGDAPTIANDRTIFLDTADPTAWNNIAQGWASGTWDGSKVATTDWAKFVTQTGVTQQHTLSVSGGTEKTKAYGSFGYMDNTGTLKGQSYKRYNGNVSVDIAPNKWFSMGANLNTSYGVNEYGQSTVGRSAVASSGGIYQTARQNLPYAMPFDANGVRIINPGGDSTIRNVYDEHLYSQDQRVTLRAFGSFYAQLDLGAISSKLDGLKYRVNFGPDITAYRNGVFLDGQSSARSGTSYASLSKDQTISYTLDQLLFYNKTLGNHNFGLTLLQSQTQYRNEGNAMSAEKIPNSANKWNALIPSNVPVLASYSSDLTETGLLSYMGRINYGYADKYLITASGRFDGASQLAPGNKWAFFPSTALAWRLDKEEFLQNVSWINQLKLRAGYGITGNAAVAAYATQPPLAGIVHPFGSGLSNNTSLGNLDLTWEKTTQYNYGVDFSILNSRISGSLEYYTSKTTDLLLSRTIPTVTGFATTLENVGATEGNGVELTLNTVNVKTADFEWSSSLSASWQKSKIVELQNGKFDDINNTRFIGQPQGIIYGFASNGIWKPEDAAEMAKFNANSAGFSFGNARPVDQNGDYKIDANDRVIIGSTEPKFVTGLTNTFNYKNFELSFFIYGRMNYLSSAGAENLSGKTSQRVLDYYTENNINAAYQKPIYSAATGDQYHPTLGYLDGSFLKIRNISLGYNFTDELAEKIGVSKLRMYLQASNPGMLFSKAKWMDFDTQTTYSNRGFTLGLNVQF